jgi:hypothetical protein
MTTTKKETRGAKPQIIVEIAGQYRTLQELSKEYGLSYITLSKRYHSGKRGYDLVAPIDDTILRNRAYREYEQQLIRNRYR